MSDLLDELRDFTARPVGEALGGRADRDLGAHLVAHFQRVAARVPAYRALLAEHGIDPARVRTRADFERLPYMTREGYVRRYPLAARCRDGRLDGCDMLAVSSGSTGEPTVWPRSVADELGVAARFEQVFFDNFEADRRSTLAVVCFPLGTWIGGMFTASCCRHLASKGLRVVTITPGNNKAEIYRALQTVGAELEQVVLLGYPPFLKDVVDGGAAAGLDWARLRPKLVLAGEVVSESWRSLMLERAHLTRPLHDIASLYGTADGGVLGNETPLSIAIRGFLAREPEAARALFGEARLPTLVQYDPLHRTFEARDGSLVFSGDNGVPLVRYDIADTGGLVDYEAMLAFCAARGFDPVAAARAAGERGVHALPFVYVFGRAHFAVSFYGANVFPETVSVGLEQADVREAVTGKFVMEIERDADHNHSLHVAVELALGKGATPQLSAQLAANIRASLLRLNSEFASYVPAARQLPRVSLWAAQSPEYFPAGVKHRYSR